MKTQQPAARTGLVIAAVLLLPLGGCTEPPADPLGTPAASSVVATQGATDPMSKVNRLPAVLEQKVGVLRADLEARGYDVARGYWTVWGAEDCKYPLRTVGMCYGNNPTAPYALAVLPRWKDEYVDMKLHHALMAAQRNMSPNYRLAGREALVILAELPPPARYFGLGTNVFTRETVLNDQDPIYLRVTDVQLRDILFGMSPNPARMMMVASIGNSINNVVIEQQSAAAFSQHRYFIVTPDQDMAADMIAALVRAGVMPDHIFTEPVAPALVRVGLGPEADDLITYVRYAMPVNEVQGEDWWKRLPLTVLRVRDPRAAEPVNPFPVPAYYPRSWNRDERTQLGADLQALAAAVRAQWQQPAAATLPFFSAYIALDLVGQHCLGSLGPGRGPMDCLGDSPDSDYQISPSLHIDDGQVIAVVGTLGTETGNATYVSLSINWFPALVGVQNIPDPQLRGTAAPFAGALQHEDRFFYVHYVARNCSGLHPCLEVSKKDVPLQGAIKAIQRNYVAPGSRSGPDPTRMLNPVAIVLDGRSRPPAP